MQTENEILILITLGILSMLIMVLAILVFAIMYHKKSISSKLEIEKIKTKQKEVLISKISATQEGERKRISANLHDEIGASLSAVNLMIGRIRLETEGSSKELAIQAGEQIKTTMSEVRNIVQNLSPAIVEKFGFFESVNEISRRLNSTGSINVKINTDCNISFQNKTIELKLYRIIQELTNNVIKHANAANLNLSFATKDDNFSIEVKDNGIGIDDEIVENSKSLGIENVKTQVEILSGTFTLQNLNNNGTLVEVIIPLESLELFENN